MPDRIAGVAATIYVDAPKLTAPATVTVTNALGSAVVSGGAATSHGDGRFSVALASGHLAVHGVYGAVWTGANGATAAQTFSVGPQPAAGLTRWDIRLQVARQEGLAIESVITDYEAGLITDQEMAGGPGNYLNRWLTLHPDAGHALAGKARRIADFNGSAFQLSSPFGTAPAAGDKYAIFLVDPREVDAALKTAYRELGGRSRIAVVLAGLIGADGPTVAALETVQVTLPTWLTHIDTVWTSLGAEVPSSNWKLAPGRRLLLRDSESGEAGAITVGSTITLRGQREFVAPAFEDSLVDAESRALIARAAMPLMASRSGGAGIDLKDHLRRHAMAQQEWDLSLQHASGRPASGSRPVID